MHWKVKTFNAISINFIMKKYKYMTCSCYLHVHYKILHDIFKIYKWKHLNFKDLVEENQIFILGEFPFQVCLFNISNGEPEGSGSLITLRHVLTARHCVENVTLSDYRVCLYLSILKLLDFNCCIFKWHNFPFHFRKKV
jgi:hypothetical protein